MKNIIKKILGATLTVTMLFIHVPLWRSQKLIRKAKLFFLISAYWRLGKEWSIQSSHQMEVKLLLVLKIYQYIPLMIVPNGAFGIEG